MKRDTTSQADLNIIILNFNGQSCLEVLLPSLRLHYLKHTRFQVDVTVVDNASTDGSVGFLRSLPWVNLIESTVNGGFAYGNNLALRTVNARYLLLLNSDTEIPTQGCDIDRLINYLDEHEQVGVITPTLLLDDGQMDQACHRGEPTPWAAITYLTKLDRLFPNVHCLTRYHQGWKKLDTIHTIDACSGAAMMVRKSAMDTIGLLDERFFIYAEDVDWCRRFREAGFEVVFHPDVTITHHKYQSGIRHGDSKIQTETKKWFYTTMLQYYDKHHKGRFPTIYRALLRLYIWFKIR